MALVESMIDDESGRCLARRTMRAFVVSAMRHRHPVVVRPMIVILILLLISVLLLQSIVVRPPAAMRRHPRPGQRAREHDVDASGAFRQYPTRPQRLRFPHGGKADVGPSRERLATSRMLAVPIAVAVPREYERVYRPRRSRAGGGKAARRRWRRRVDRKGE